MTTPTTFAGLVNALLDIIDMLIGFLFVLAFLVLIWKIVDTWIINAADPGKREEGKSVAISAALVMVLMSSIWGILALLRNSF